MKEKVGILLAWIIFLGILGGICLAFNWQEYKEVNDLPVKVIFPRLKNDADCTLFIQGDKAVMIDAGEKDDAQNILNVLEENNIEKLKYLILTHPDSDHIGGVEDILKTISVNRVIQTYYNKENDDLLKLIHLFKEMKIDMVYPLHTMKIHVGAMRFLIYPPLEKNYSNTNNYSLAVLMQHKEVNMFFTGDALKKRTKELLTINFPPIQVLKVPHHGRANSLSKKFLQEIYPDYAVVTSENADEIIKKTCNELGIQLIYTRKGNCIFESSGTEISLIETKRRPIK